MGISALRTVKVIELMISQRGLWVRQERCYDGRENSRRATTLNPKMAGSQSFDESSLCRNINSRRRLATVASAVITLIQNGKCQGEVLAAQERRYERRVGIYRQGFYEDLPFVSANHLTKVIG
jgi:hypothetical protein